MISTNMKMLQRIIKMVAVARGEDKIDAIIGVLRTGAVNHPITDDGTAGQL
ncbi:MAG: hypothetical protein GX127_02840 [Eubacteriaceae bacterium]|nr:hypothetical protein [Eubacteriaceae bacterium]